MRELGEAKTSMIPICGSIGQVFASLSSIVINFQYHFSFENEKVNIPCVNYFFLRIATIPL